MLYPFESHLWTRQAIEALTKAQREIDWLRAALEEALTVLPDSDHADETWDWAWAELSRETRDEIEEVRRNIVSALDGTKPERVADEH